MRPESGRGRRLCVFQMHHTDADEKLFELNAVEPVSSSGLFDRVCIAAADVPENDVLEDFAARMGVPLFRGAERDVARRIADCAAQAGAELIARALVWWFFVDLDLVRRQMDQLEASSADALLLPADFDIRFGMDVFRPRFLERCRELFASDPSISSVQPWGLAEAHPEAFRLERFEAVPVHDRSHFESVRERMRWLWPERWDGQGMPLAPYRIARDLMPAGGRALDVACGLGAGTALLAEKGTALGIDLSWETIQLCRARHPDRGRFEVADALAVDLPAEGFDVVTSVHTMEHVADHDAFLERIARWLVPGGHLVLEVPLLASRPFLGIDTPLSPGHVREYEPRALCQLVSRHLELVESHGIARGARVPLERARSAAICVARKPKR